jgi:hypothetical protein
LRQIEKYDFFDDSYLKEQESIIKPKEQPIIPEVVEKKGRPALVLMDLAKKIITSEENMNPQAKKLTELQKGRIACNYIAMNNSPKKFNYYRRFINNDGNVKVPGFDPKTGQKADLRKALLMSMNSASQILESMDSANVESRDKVSPNLQASLRVNSKTKRSNSRHNRSTSKSSKKSRKKSDKQRLLKQQTRMFENKQKYTKSDLKMMTKINRQLKKRIPDIESTILHNSDIYENECDDDLVRIIEAPNQGTQTLDCTMGSKDTLFPKIGSFDTRPDYL